MQKEKIENNPLLKRSFEFSLLIIDYCDVLESHRKFVFAHQLLKCGTSIGANAMEAQNAESKADFIHKTKIAAKEAEETQYWLRLCEYSDKYPNRTLLLGKIEELHRIL